MSTGHTIKSGSMANCQRTREYGPYRDADGNRTIVTVSFEDVGEGRTRILFTGSEYRKHSSHPFASGQHKGSAPTSLKRLWDRWHLNDMKAGCAHQEARYRDHPEDRPTYSNDYRGATGDRLSPDEGSACPQCGYRYGSAWVYEQLPDDLIEQIDAASRDYRVVRAALALAGAEVDS